MPSSAISGTEAFARFVDALIEFEDTDTVLDVGCGAGRFGLIVRELTDIKAGRFKREQFKLNLIGVDIWPAYLCEIQKAIYTSLIKAEAYKFLKDYVKKVKTGRKRKVKLCILSHILEHMKKKRGWETLEQARLCSHYVIVGVPLLFVEQKPIFGNELEAHISEWTLNELVKISKRFEIAGNYPHPAGVFLIEGKS